MVEKNVDLQKTNFLLSINFCSRSRYTWVGLPDWDFLQPLPKFRSPCHFFHCRLVIAGGAESTGYITDEPGLENISLLNEAGLTDAEGALSDVNSLYNAPDVDDTSVSSRASSRLLSLDSLSGLYDCDMDSKHEMAIVNVSNKITNKFGPPQQQQQQQSQNHHTHPQHQQQS